MENTPLPRQPRQRRSERFAIPQQDDELQYLTLGHEAQSACIPDAAPAAQAAPEVRQQAATESQPKIESRPTAGVPLTAMPVRQMVQPVTPQQQPYSAYARRMRAQEAAPAQAAAPAPQVNRQQTQTAPAADAQQPYSAYARRMRAQEAAPAQANTPTPQVNRQQTQTAPAADAQQPYSAYARRLRAQEAAPAQANTPTPQVNRQQTQSAPATDAQQPSAYHMQRTWAQETHQPAQPRSGVQYPDRTPAPTPRALQQQQDSTWQAPAYLRTQRSTLPQEDELPAETPEAAPRAGKLPGWLTTALCIALVLVMALVAAQALLMATLKTEQDKQQAAWEAILKNYHVTEQEDGTMRVTWQGAVEHYAAQYNLQPAFVIAIIRTESSFYTDATSSVNARGLMQLMPDTAGWIAEKLDDDDYTFDRMYDPDVNIRYGCWYLGYLSRLFRGDPVLVSAAYHAGQSEITRWLSDPAISKDGVTIPIESMPDGPTKQYAGRVTTAYGTYQTLLYPENAFEPAAGDAAGDDDLPDGSAS